MEFRRIRLAAVPVLLVAFAACSDEGGIPTGPLPGDLSPAKVKIQTLAAADVIVAGSDGGAFVNAFTADNSGRLTTEFWDNLSADITPGVNETCNIGFYAAGTVLPGCLHEAGTANQGGYATGKYWGDGAGGRDASSFMFAGAYSYTVTLQGTYHGSVSDEVGYFTKTAGGVYSFFPLSQAIGSAQTINTGGADWGFYVKNDFNPQTGGCASPDTDCSDATGGFSGVQFQQFALFVDATETSYLVGVEDNKLELFPNNGTTYEDSDYNDYIFSVVPTSPTLTQGRMTGGGIVTYDGQNISLGFTLHCDITLSNNLEINWPGNKWHLDKPITLALCSDDPAILQKPPVAPLDTFEGEGYGKLNGVAGSKVEFVLVDAGEPGTDDMVRLKVYAPNSSVVLDLPLTLLNKGGNVQAHYDQPHGNKP